MQFVNEFRIREIICRKLLTLFFLHPDNRKRMRMTPVFLLSISLYANVGAIAQKVSLHQKDVALEKALGEITRQSGYRFFYTQGLLNGAPKVTINIDNADINEVLLLCFKGQPFTFGIVGKTVVIKEKVEKQHMDASSPPGDIKGIVVNENGEPVAGVTVKIKGTDIGTFSSAGGTFSFTGVDAKPILVFTGANIEDFEMKVNGNSSLVVNVKIKMSRLDEVQVIAYGTTTKRLSTGSISKVSSEEIERQPVTNVLAALEGRVPGLVVSQTNGLPGAGFTVQIRGQNFLGTVSTDPLYVIDGVLFYSGSLNTMGNGTAYKAGANGSNTSPLNSINPADIESIEVLKGADATAIYGSLAANGVLLITTKKAKAGKTKLDINASTGASIVGHTVPLLNTQQYRQMRRQAFANDGKTPTLAIAPDLFDWGYSNDTTRYTDFNKALLGGTARTVDASANFSGGDFRTRFLLGSTWHHETTVFPGDMGYGRGSVHFNVEHNSPDRKFTSTITVSYTMDKNNLPVSDLTAIAYQLPPNYLLYDSTGKLFWGNGQSNPLSYLKQLYVAKTNNLVGNIALRYSPVIGLNLRANIGYNKLTFDQQVLNYSESLNPALNFKPNAYYTQNYTESYIIEPQADYTRMISQGKLNVLIGGTWTQNTFAQPFFIYASNYASDDLLGSLAAAGSLGTPSNGYSEYRYQSLFGRLNYTWQDKYIINASMRRDGSSRFGDNNKYGNFGAIGAGWIFSQERFISAHYPWLSFGKLRGSYGVVGSQPNADYRYASIYNATTSYGTTAALIPGNIANPDLQWGVSKNLEAALELGFLKDRLLVTATGFRNRSGNQLLIYAISAQAGFSGYTANFPALVQNTGLELELTSVNIKNRVFSWNSAFTITFQQNKLVDFPGIANSQYFQSYIVGQPLSAIYATHYIGIDTNGLPAIQDINKSGSIESYSLASTGKGDEIAVGNLTPAYFGGLNNSFRYKDFQLDLFFQFSHQQGQMSIINYNTMPGYNASNLYAGILNLWPAATQAKMATTVSSSAAYAAYSNYIASDALVVDASFIRMKNVSISYTFPAKWTNRIKVASCRLYVHGQNLFVITGYKGYDPETRGTGMPPLKTLVGGIQLSF